jgi:hypothetical protein
VWTQAAKQCRHSTVRDSLSVEPIWQNNPGRVDSQFCVAGGKDHRHCRPWLGYRRAIGAHSVASNRAAVKATRVCIDFLPMVRFSRVGRWAALRLLAAGRLIAPIVTLPSAVSKTVGLMGHPERHSSQALWVESNFEERDEYLGPSKHSSNAFRTARQRLGWCNKWLEFAEPPSQTQSRAVLTYRTALPGL